MRRNIYMNGPLDRLAKTTQGGGFSRRLGEIVERYQIMLDLDGETLPKLSDIELSIMGEVVCGVVIDRRKIRGLHLDVLDASIGTVNERKELSNKMAGLTAGQRLVLIEKLGQ